MASARGGAGVGQARPAVTIRELRAERGLSLRGLARIVGIDNPLLSRLETGILEPGPALRARIAAVLEVEPDRLVPPPARR